MLKSVKNIDLQIPGLQVKRKIGEGGMSVVYLAEQLSLKREVAIKVLRLDVADNELDVQRFKQEAKTIAHLHHPNIIDIYDIGQTKNGEVYFTMPYLNHGNFSTYQIDEEKEFIKLLKSICDGLAFAHNRGVVHRDIKPDNLIFDAFGNVKIADFGIALSKKGVRMTKEHQIVGSAQYMSPEQARSLKVELQSDVYSLGIVIYERLTGKVPFDADEGIAVLVNHVSMPPPKLPPKVKHWQKLIDKCLAKDPKNRFQSMYELKHALNKIPINPIQKTNYEIYKALTNKYNFSPVWLGSLILIVGLLGYYFYTQKESTLPVEKTTEKQVVKSKPTVKPVESGFSEIRVNDKPILTEQKSDQLEKKPEVQVTVKEESLPKQEIKIASSDLSFMLFQGAETTAKEPENFVELAFQHAENQQTVSQQTTTEQATTHQTTTEQATTHQTITEQTTNQQAVKIENAELIITDKNTNEVQDHVDKGFANIEEYKLILPSDDNATDDFLKVLELDPQNEQATEGLNLIAKTYYLLINAQISALNFNKSLTHTESFIAFLGKTQLESEEINEYKKSINNLISETNMSSNTTIVDVNNAISMVKLLGSKEDLLSELYDVKEKVNLRIQAQEYLQSQGIETIKVNSQIAFTKSEITVAQYSLFINASQREESKCKHQGGGIMSIFGSKSWQKPYFDQSTNHPVVCISWDDAKAYAKWLSQKTTMKFRLPKKSDWLLISGIQNNEFSACKSANVSAQEAIKIRNKDENYSCDDQYKFTAPVATFSANALGFYDVQGNVSEWLDSCETSSCLKASAVGSSWFDGKQLNQINKENYLKSSSGYTTVGFRLVKED